MKLGKVFLQSPGRHGLDQDVIKDAGTPLQVP